MHGKVSRDSGHQSRIQQCIWNIIGIFPEHRKGGKYNKHVERLHVYPTSEIEIWNELAVLPN